MRASVITVSSALASSGEAGSAGPALVQRCEAYGLETGAELVAEERTAIVAALRRQIDDDVRFVFTTGGTGLTALDQTPDATHEVIERIAPGFAEAMRAESRRYTALGTLTRGTAGIAGRTLIVNFPGNPKAIEQLWPVVEPTLGHAAYTLER